MDLNLVKKIIKIVEQSDISELTVQEGELKISVSKNSGRQMVSMAAPPPAPVYNYNPLAGAPVSNDGYYEIKSPIVGTFYKASAPDADPFVKEGDMVKPGAVLCIVEAMKLMNEIESDVSGKIVKILVENASPVEYNQPLFLIEKD